MPEKRGGTDLDFRFNATVLEERAYAGSYVGTAIHSDVVAPDYLIRYGSDAQNAYHLPKTVSGDRSEPLR